jgi:K+-sensing histidine kinase KdpD
VDDYVTTPYQKRQALYNLEMQEMYRSMQKGKVEDALRNIAALSSPQERAQLLTQVANQIGPGYKRAAVLLFLEQARGLLPPSAQAQDQTQMQALFEIAKAFARYDSKRAFEVFDPLVDQFNDLSTAARTMNGFVGEFYEQDELNMQNGNSISGLAQQLTFTLGTLGLSNFDRATATAERVEQSESILLLRADVCGNRAVQVVVPVRVLIDELV